MRELPGMSWSDIQTLTRIERLTFLNIHAAHIGKKDATE